MGFERWRQLGQRLARMDGAELRERLRQEVRKRQDAALAQIGYDFSRRSSRSAGDRTGRFFFAADTVESILPVFCQRSPARFSPSYASGSQTILRERWNRRSEYAGTVLICLAIGALIMAIPSTGTLMRFMESMLQGNLFIESLILTMRNLATARLHGN